MFELVALFSVAVVGGLVIGALFLALAAVKFVFKIALMPLKLLFFPLVLIAMLLKVVLAVTVVGLIVAVIVPLIVVGLVVGIPAVLISALT